MAFDAGSAGTGFLRGFLAIRGLMNEEERMKQNQERWQKTMDYQRSRDQMTDARWQQSFDQTQSNWQQTYDTTQSNWQKNYDATQAHRDALLGLQRSQEQRNVEAHKQNMAAGKLTMEASQLQLDETKRAIDADKANKLTRSAIMLLEQGIATPDLIEWIDAQPSTQEWLKTRYRTNAKIVDLKPNTFKGTPGSYHTIIEGVDPKTGKRGRGVATAEDKGSTNGQAPLLEFTPEAVTQVMYQLAQQLEGASPEEAERLKKATAGYLQGLQRVHGPLQDSLEYSPDGRTWIRGADGSLKAANRGKYDAPGGYGGSSGYGAPGSLTASQRETHWKNTAAMFDDEMGDDLDRGIDNSIQRRAALATAQAASPEFGHLPPAVLLRLAKQAETPAATTDENGNPVPSAPYILTKEAALEQAKIDLNKGRVLPDAIGGYDINDDEVKTRAAQILKEETKAYSENLRDAYQQAAYQMYMRQGLRQFAPQGQPQPGQPQQQQPGMPQQPGQQAQPETLQVEDENAPSQQEVMDEVVTNGKHYNDARDLIADIKEELRANGESVPSDEFLVDWVKREHPELGFDHWREQRRGLLNYSNSGPRVDARTVLQNKRMEMARQSELDEARMRLADLAALRRQKAQQEKQR